MMALLYRDWIDGDESQRAQSLGCVVIQTTMSQALRMAMTINNTIATARTCKLNGTFIAMPVPELAMRKNAKNGSPTNQIQSSIGSLLRRHCA